MKKLTLVVGASENPERYAYKAANLLLTKGHSIILFGNKKGEIFNHSIVTIWPDSESIDTVTLYVGPQNQKDIMDKCIALRPKRIIFNPGTENPEFFQKAEANGIEATEACTLVLLHTNQY